MSAIFKTLIRGMVGMYRLTDGKVMGSMAGLNVLLLTATGRKTGKKHSIPLGYFEHDGGYVIIASLAGADHHPNWFLNLKANPNVRIRVREKQMDAKAEIIGSELRNQLWPKLVAMSPQYGKYQENTTRQIPLIHLRPVA